MCYSRFGSFCSLENIVDLRFRWGENAVRLANIDVLRGTFTLDGYLYVAWRGVPAPALLPKPLWILLPTGGRNGTKSCDAYFQACREPLCAPPLAECS